MQFVSSPEVESASIEDLFTLGLFSDAYRAGEAEILRRLSERSLPRALLPPRLPTPASSTGKTSSDLRKSNDTRLATSTPERTTQSASGIAATPLATSAPAPSSSSQSSSAGSSSTSRSPNSNINSPFAIDSGKSSGLASSSAPAAPPKPREIHFDHLAESDQLKLKTLAFESVPILAVMMQCLFELQLGDQIVPLLLPLCGPRLEEYPFELAFLIVNLHVTTKNYTQARKTCETLLSNIRSQLGPLPLKTPTKSSKAESSSKPHTLDTMTDEGDASSPSKLSSSSSDSQPTSLSDEDNEYESEEDEPIIALRHRLMSLLQLYIFHILCPLHQYADAKSYLFTEARIMPTVLQEWIFCVDEAEKTHIEEVRKAEEQRKGQPQLPADSAPRADGLPIPTQPKASATSTHSSTSWWRALIGDDGDEEADSLIPSGPASQVAKPYAPMHVRLLKGLLRVYSWIEQRYQVLTPEGKQALHALLSLVAAALIYLVYSSRWYKRLELRKWLSGRLAMFRNMVIGAPAPTHNHRLLAQQLGASRGLLGSGGSSPQFR